MIEPTQRNRDRGTINPPLQQWDRVLSHNKTSRKKQATTNTAAVAAQPHGRNNKSQQGRQPRELQYKGKREHAKQQWQNYCQFPTLPNLTTDGPFWTALIMFGVTPREDVSWWKVTNHSKFNNSMVKACMAVVDPVAVEQ